VENPFSTDGHHVDMCREALRYHDAGLPITPCKGKRPILDGWQERRLSRDELSSVVTDSTNIGLVLNQTDPGLMDVECDGPEPEAQLQQLLGADPEPTPTWRSRRGLHRLYLAPAGLPEKAVDKVDGIECRIGNGKGAQSILPPSIHPDTHRRYEWLPGLSIHEIPPAPLPEALARRLCDIDAGCTGTPEEPSAVALALGVITEGERNNRLFRLACQLRREGHSQGELTPMVMGLNHGCCRPPLSDDEVLRTIQSAVERVDEDSANTWPYAERNGRIVRLSLDGDGKEHASAVCNFTAKIRDQTTIDDGVERRITLGIEGQLATGEPLPRAAVSAAEYASMSWIIPAWGTRAVVYAGIGAKDHLRAAIQIMSRDVPHQTVYEHTGWREIDGQWFYLHAGGAIGADGLVDHVSVSLQGRLALYVLPAPPEVDELRECIRASLAIVGLAPEPITMSLLGAAYRAVLAPADFTPHLAGPTGTGKTELAALMQQHYGACMDARQLPGSWSSTGNSLESAAFHAKDAIFVADDFAPHGGQSDVARYHRDADRVLRAQGNRSGRDRCRPDGSLRTAKPPRGMILSTGEDIPRGQSLRSRMWILEVAPGDMRWDLLTQCQADAAAGRYAGALAGFVRWLASRIGELRRSLPERIAKIRAGLTTEGQHARTPGIAADLLCGWQLWTEYAVKAGAINLLKRLLLLRKARLALLAAAARQAPHVESAEPASHFLRLIAAAIAAGRAHVASTWGQSPGDGWGWQDECVGEHMRSRSCGQRVGWLVGDDLYLEPDASYAVAQDLARSQGEALTVTGNTIRKRLHEKGLLVSCMPGKLTQRRTLDGQSRLVLHLRADSICAHESVKPVKNSSGS
jgi:hypothetical protein